MFQSITIVGNLGKDPDVRPVGNTKVATMPVATSKAYKNKKGERVQETTWHDVVLWGALADVAERFLQKGSTVLIQGEIKKTSWDGNDGKKYYATELVGNSLKMLGEPKRKEAKSAPPPEPRGVDAWMDDVNPDDAPF